MPRKPCAQPMCGDLVSYGEVRCAKHRKLHNRLKDRDRLTAHQRGYDSKWRKAREGFLAKHPLCAHHKLIDEIEPATVVDHITPHRGNRELFWDRDNWQPLCKSCHDRKTATEDGGFTGWQ